MKKLLLLAIVFIAFIGSIHAMNNTSANNDFEIIMQLPWSQETETIIDRSWQFWTDPQKQRILSRMEEEGLLSAAEIASWPMHQVPRKSYGG